jgi:predicted nucleic acid-binding protein
VIVLDTNVVSELMRPQPSAAVAAWVARQPLQSVFTTSITRAEILYGIAVIPDGRRKTALAAGAERMFREYFAGRSLGFGDAAAVYYAAILSSRRRAGRPIAPLDRSPLSLWLRALLLRRAMSATSQGVGLR